MAEPKRANELKSTGYELFIAALSILSILNIFLAIFIPNPDVARVLMIMNGILSAIFLADFTILPPRVRLGGPAGQLAVSGLEDPARLPSLPRLSPDAQVRTEEHAA
jgi:hypothetical protein